MDGSSRLFRQYCTHEKEEEEAVADEEGLVGGAYTSPERTTRRWKAVSEWLARSGKRRSVHPQHADRGQRTRCVSAHKQRFAEPLTGTTWGRNSSLEKVLFGRRTLLVTILFAFVTTLRRPAISPPLALHFLSLSLRYSAFFFFFTAWYDHEWPPCPIPARPPSSCASSSSRTPSPVRCACCFRCSNALCGLRSLLVSAAALRFGVRGELGRLYRCSC